MNTTLDHLRVRPGDVISCSAGSATIGAVIYADTSDPGSYDIEFRDDRGQYRHWKQAIDGGHIFRNGHILRVDSYGMDVSDLFARYGY